MYIFLTITTGSFSCQTGGVVGVGGPKYQTNNPTTFRSLPWNPTVEADIVIQVTTPPSSFFIFSSLLFRYHR